MSVSPSTTALEVESMIRFLSSKGQLDRNSFQTDISARTRHTRTMSDQKAGLALSTKENKHFECPEIQELLHTRTFRSKSIAASK
jgi:hypothetical protein